MAWRTTCLAVVVSMTTGCVGPKTIYTEVRKLGYSDVQRPTNLWTPGTIVAIRSAAPFEAARICTTEDALGATFKVDESPALSFSWSRKTSTKFEIEGSYQKAINARLGFDAIKNITFELSNTKVYETSDSAVLRAASNGGTSQACKDAITRRFNANQPMTMLSSALQADVTYTVQFNADIDTEVKYSVTQEIAPELTAGAVVKGEGRIEGKGIIFGIIDDRQLLSSFASVVPGMPQLAASPVVAASNRRLIPIGVTISATDAEK